MAAITHNDPVNVRFDNGAETVWLWLAIGVAALFIGLLIYDQVARRRRIGRSHLPRESFLTLLRRPFREAKLLREELRRVSRERSRRKERAGRNRPTTKR